MNCFIMFAMDFLDLNKQCIWSGIPLIIRTGYPCFLNCFEIKWLNYIL